MRRLKIAGDLDIETLEKRYRDSQDVIASRPWQIVWLLAKGEPSEAVGQATGYSVKWIRQLAHRYNVEGAAAVGDQRHHNPGRALSLSKHDQQSLKRLLSEAAAHHESWTGVAVAAWMSARLGRKVYAQRGWEMLRRLGFRPQRGRIRHVHANAADQDAYKKRSPLPRKPGR